MNTEPYFETNLIRSNQWTSSYMTSLTEVKCSWVEVLVSESLRASPSLIFTCWVIFGKVLTFSVSHLLHRIVEKTKYVNAYEFLYCYTASTQIWLLLILLLFLLHKMSLIYYLDLFLSKFLDQLWWYWQEIYF